MYAYEIIISDDGLRDICQGYLASMEGFKVKNQAGSIYCESENPALGALSFRLSHFILDAREEKKFLGFLDELFPRFGPEDRNFILKKARRLLASTSLEWGVFAGKNRYRRLSGELFEYFLDNCLMDLEGFIRFHLTGYDEYLIAVLTTAAEDIINREEELACLNIFHKYLGEHFQSPGCYHLVLFKNGIYNILKERERYEIVSGGREQGCEDILITQLMELAPEKIIVHLEEGRSNSVADKLLGEIFETRLSYCPGCKICRSKPVSV